MDPADRAFLADWTILVFLNAKNGHEIESFRTFEQMARVGSTSRVNVVVEYGRPQRNRPDADGASAYGGWSGTKRFRVAKGMEPTEDAAVGDPGDVDMGTGAAVADFVTWGWTTFPARRTMLVLWGRNRPGNGEPASWRYVSHDEDAGDKLYVREIQDALTGLASLGTVDVVGFDAGLMGTVETAYALRHCASVMVASEELSVGAGWDYGRFLAALVADPRHVEPADVGRLLVDAYARRHGEGGIGTQSAIDLTKVEDLAAAVSRFAESVGQEDFPQIAAARRACRDYGRSYGTNTVDLGRFLDEVQRVSGHVSEHAASARAALDDVVIANHASRARQGEFGSHGLAIYFPENRLAYHVDPEWRSYGAGSDPHPIEFVDREKWAAFVHAYMTWVAYPD